MLTFKTFIPSLPTHAGSTYKSTTANQTISCSGKKMTSNIIIQGDSNLKAENIKKGISILGVAGGYSGLMKYEAYLRGSTTTMTFDTFDGNGARARAYYVEIPPLNFTPKYVYCSAYSQVDTGGNGVSECSNSMYWGLHYHITPNGGSGSSSTHYTLTPNILSKNGFKLPVHGSKVHTRVLIMGEA